MKGLWSLIVGLTVVLTGIPAAQAQFGRDRNNNRADRDEVCVYHDNYYQGQEQCFRAGDEVGDLGGLNRNISSIHVYGRARVTLYEGRNFQGNSIQFTNDVTDLARVSMNGSSSWNDRAGSLRVSGNGQGSGYGNPGYRRDDNYGQYGRNGQSGICVYENSEYRGRSQCFDAGQSEVNLATMGWGDRISSIRVFGGARAFLYTNARFGGARLSVDRDMPDLGRLNISGTGASWSHQISSLEVQGGRNRQSYRYYDNNRYYGR
jgi:hypothetical protein